MSDFSFVPLRPFFCAALAKRWKVQFRQGFAYCNNVDSQTIYINENCRIIYIYELSLATLSRIMIHIYIYICVCV